MARGIQLSSLAWVVVPSAAFAVGLGCRAITASLRKKSTARGSNADTPDVVRTETPHPDWTPGQKQPPPEELRAGQILGVYVS